MLCRNCGASEAEHIGIPMFCPGPFSTGMWKSPGQAATVKPAVKSEKPQPNRATLPEDPAERKKYPIATGVLDYFPDAIAALARLSWEGNQQHNPGEPLHWAREKSTDQDDTTMRHFMERGRLDKDGQRHSAKAAWRMLAILQLEIEAEREGN